MITLSISHDGGLADLLHGIEDYIIDSNLCVTSLNEKGTFASTIGREELIFAR